MTDAPIWFTADHHFGHANIIRYCARPFNSVGEMDATLIRNWNEMVGADDVVYHLGDFTLGDTRRFTALAANLNGHILIVPGSHDGQWLGGFHPEIPTRSGHFVQLLPPLVSLEFPERGTGRHPLVVVLCHYAMRIWDRAHYGAWHLYGHSHGRLPPQGRSLDVGVDCHNFRPISIEAIAERMPSVADEGSSHLRCPDLNSSGRMRSCTMIHELDTVVLTRDLPEHGLVAGDVGAVVHSYAGGTLRNPCGQPALPGRPG